MHLPYKFTFFAQVWDVAKGAAVSLRRWGGGGVSLVKFSPEGSKLFAGCPSTFRYGKKKQ